MQTTINKKFFGPYLRSGKNEKWHWVKSCPHFPQSVNMEFMISSSPPPPEILCKE